MAGFERLLPDAAATEAFGERLAACLTGGALVFLNGDLGAGKTTLVRGVLHGLGHTGRVKSPTYTLIEPYTIDARDVYHLDLYRLADAGELEWIGVRDLVGGEALCLIEWPQRGHGFLPQPDLDVELEVQSRGRQIRVRAGSESGRRILRCIESSSL
jgi:tRNA threonylcarbamoyladenosine biosynthesis protein TsaE